MTWWAEWEDKQKWRSENFTEVRRIFLEFQEENTWLFRKNVAFCLEPSTRSNFQGRSAHWWSFRPRFDETIYIWNDISDLRQRFIQCHSSKSTTLVFLQILFWVKTLKFRLINNCNNWNNTWVQTFKRFGLLFPLFHDAWNFTEYFKYWRSRNLNLNFEEWSKTEVINLIHSCLQRLLSEKLLKWTWQKLTFDLKSFGLSWPSSGPEFCVIWPWKRPASGRGSF